MGATDTLGRLVASIGQAGPPPVSFEAACDTVNAGVLLALPALLAAGLLHRTEKHFNLPPGYYRLNSIFLLLAFMALARLKNVESLRYSDPGEWGKVLGLDRVPEARTLREKIALLAIGDKPAKWSSELCSVWMQGAPEQAGALYVDGHVRVYNGKQAHLPRHFVSRQKLCLRATVDYWVNAMDGQPFFFAHKDIDPGLVSVLEHDIIPRLIDEVPNQPSPEALEADPDLHRFIVVFDREGYSPELFGRLREQHIACLTYNKYPGEDWDVEEFTTKQVALVSGQVVDMQLAEHVSQKKGCKLREVRRLTDTGHQTAVIATDYKADMTRVAARMFARWSQENFFKYMEKQFDLDRLVEYSSEEIPDASKVNVVNPEYRRLDQDLRRTRGRLIRKQANVDALAVPPLSTPNLEKAIEVYQEKKAELDREVAELKTNVEKLKEARKGHKKHTTLDKLPEAERFTRLRPQAKHLLDTIKMVAYRAETAMANILDETPHDETARRLLQEVYTTHADLVPNQIDKTLTVRLHHLANRSSDEAIRHLCAELNATRTIFPDTDLRLVYELVS